MLSGIPSIRPQSSSTDAGKLKVFPWFFALSMALQLAC